MPGRQQANASGHSLEERVRAVAEGLGLHVRSQVRVGRRLWGRPRFIDVVVTDLRTRRVLGIECKFQAGPGTAEEKIPAVVQDITAWPIPGIVVFDGAGFSPDMRQFLFSTGKVVELVDLEDWLRLYFALPLDR